MISFVITLIVFKKFQQVNKEFTYYELLMSHYKFALYVLLLVCPSISTNGSDNKHWIYFALHHINPQLFYSERNSNETRDTQYASLFFLRKLKGVHFTITNGFYGIFLAVFSTLYWYVCRKLPNPDLQYNFDFYQIELLILTAIFSNFANQFAIMALKYDKAGRIHSLSFFQVLFSFLGDILIFGYNFTSQQLVGAVVIISCSIVIMLLKYFMKDE
ncbi:UNKNOWN [Stylonychia lemnae]|uniref:Uncharacterized protein n=1 Tax=Stylonychia lemnae TaxID=5949 RepID=A0A077ZR14_STYLE|nr:UNKNOWN [Stylonychia lemnae]|eukprot:CDW72327.1 UNKNOWN [Stylonychia lemnae]